MGLVIGLFDLGVFVLGVVGLVGFECGVVCDCLYFAFGVGRLACRALVC